MKLDPKAYGLPPRTHLEKLEDSTIGLVIDRKSRIIMTDGKKILEKSKSIFLIAPSTQVVLVTTAPICSKTKLFLEESGIAVKKINALQDILLVPI